MAVTVAGMHLRARRVTAAIVVPVTCVALLLGGCTQDAVCGSGDYPVLRVGGTGRQCLPKGQAPAAGWARFPSGQVPAHVDDKWDVFWRTHTVDASGRTVAVSG